MYRKNKKVENVEFNVIQTTHQHYEQTKSNNFFFWADDTFFCCDRLFAHYERFALFIAFRSNGNKMTRQEFLRHCLKVNFKKKAQKQIMYYKPHNFFSRVTMATYQKCFGGEPRGRDNIKMLEKICLSRS